MKPRRFSLADYRRILGIPDGVDNDSLLAAARDASVYQKALDMISEKGLEAIAAINARGPHEHILDEFRRMIDVLPAGEMRRVLVEPNTDEFLRIAAALAEQLKART